MLIERKRITRPKKEEPYQWSDYDNGWFGNIVDAIRNARGYSSYQVQAGSRFPWNRRRKPKEGQ